MDLPEEAQKIIDSELSRLMDSPEYDAPPKTRAQLYQALGPSAVLLHDDHSELMAVKRLPELTIPDRIRARAAILTAQKAMSLWELACKETDANYHSDSGGRDAFTDHWRYLSQRTNTPVEQISVYNVPRAFVSQHILEMAELALKGGINDYGKFLIEVNEWWGIYPRPERCQREFSIKWSAQEALYLTVLWQRYLTLQDYEYRIDTDDMNEYITSHVDAPGGLAMLACSGVFDGQIVRIDADRRRRFWLWWLAWAIPTVFRLEAKLRASSKGDAAQPFYPS